MPRRIAFIDNATGIENKASVHVHVLRGITFVGLSSLRFETIFPARYYKQLYTRQLYIPSTVESLNPKSCGELRCRMREAGRRGSRGTIAIYRAAGSLVLFFPRDQNARGEVRDPFRMTNDIRYRANA